ncbi:YraN family protein [Corynebacterium doosanense]|uniref:UPF0102 protein CDOO_08900 n=1 Tax=Corynebacterium doosanense CAU 212 = DSM 45436 TaxID=558173 RepID=A0A097IGU8_9CORY|nr:YraN family protein [Corynebacterium doosanense]AIT61366.1 hypothetical protein CDOO_08900 [Corynebacterium doosanense CAU 212 = DSM 45436]
MTGTIELGRRGEAYAAQFYRERGAQVIDTNVRFGSGEIDIIATEPDGTVVFVEVKTRTGQGFGGAESVTPRKLHRMRSAASRWLTGRPYAPVRFDVVVLYVAGAGFELTHYEGVEHGAG